MRGGSANGIRRGSAIVLMAVAVGLVMVAPSAAGAVAIPPGQFCVGSVLNDYEAPLDGLPKVREPPRSGRLPFGPKRLLFRALSDPFVVEGDSIEYGFSLSGVRESGGKTLGWEVESRLVRIDAKGRKLHLAHRKKQRVGRLAVAEMFEVGFQESPLPGLYRYDLLIRDRAGELLGHYHGHYLVARRNPDTRLSLNGSSFQPGETVLGQLQNFGTESVFYGVGYWIEKFGSSGWTAVDLSELYGYKVAFILIGISLRPGTSDSCHTVFPLPDGMSPGLYRLGKSVDLFSGGGLPGGRNGQELPVSAEFTVEPPA